MKNITVSVDDETHRRARIRAAELETSLSALVRAYLRSLCVESAEETRAESEGERRGEATERGGRGLRCAGRRVAHVREPVS